MNAEEVIQRVRSSLGSQESKSEPRDETTDKEIEKECYDKDDFIHYFDEEFIQNTYRKILKRPPDESGKHYYLSLLRRGKRSKMQIVTNIASSKEAKGKAKIKHLFFYRILFTLYKIPILSYVVKFFVTLLTLPKLRERFDALDNFTGAIKNELHAKIDARTKEIQELRSQLLEERSQIERLQADLLSLADEMHDQKSQIERFQADLLSLADEMHERDARLQDDFTLKIDDLAQNLEDRIKSQGSELDTRLERLKEKVELLHLHSSSISNLLNHIRADYSATFTPTKVRSFVTDDFYMALEERFRGEDTSSKLSIYLSYIKNLSTLLDIGCGRGEWLELLERHGIHAKGIDTNRIAIEKLRERFDVEAADALTYLKEQPSNSLEAISAFHLLEHLDFDYLLALLFEIHRVLEPAGLFIVEIPNPKNVGVGACNFYIDPTHKRPIPPMLLDFLLHYAGFRTTPVKLPKAAFEDEAIQDFLDEWVNQPQDYGVIGVKI